MRRFVFVLVVLLSSVAVWGAGLPRQGTVVIVSGNGVVVGTGAFSGGNLQLQLLSGFASFATLTLVDETGDILVFDVMVHEDGSVVLTDTLDELASLVKDAGGEVRLDFSAGMQAEEEEAPNAAVADEAVPLDDAERTVEDAVDDAAEGVAAAEEQGDDADPETGIGPSVGSESAGTEPDDAFGEGSDAAPAEAPGPSEEGRSRPR